MVRNTKVSSEGGRRVHVRNERWNMSTLRVTGQSGRSAARSGILCDDVLSSPRASQIG